MVQLRMLSLGVAMLLITSSHAAPTYKQCRADMLFVLDVSGTISARQFDEFKDMLRAVASNIDINSGQNRVALIRFFGYQSRKMWTVHDFDYYTV